MINFPVSGAARNGLSWHRGAKTLRGASAVLALATSRSQLVPIVRRRDRLHRRRKRHDAGAHRGAGRAYDRAPENKAPP
jgi:hypothetical protein